MTGHGYVSGANPEQLRFGAICGVVGVAVQIVMDRLHPHEADPNNSVAAFREYSMSDNWVAVHIGQLIGTLLIALALWSLYRSLAGQAGFPGSLADIGAITTIALSTIFAVLMAVDGVALKGAIDAWVAAPPAEERSAFLIADTVRWVEKGLVAFFQLINGVALLSLGLSVVLSGRRGRWLGWFGTIGGVGFLATGILVAHTGFAGVAGLPYLPTLVFVLGNSVQLWRRAALSTPEGEQKDGLLGGDGKVA